MRVVDVGETPRARVGGARAGPGRVAGARAASAGAGLEADLRRTAGEAQATGNTTTHAHTAPWTNFKLTLYTIKISVP